MSQSFTIRPAVPAEFPAIGVLLSSVYAQLDGFPKPAEQPRYYDMLARVGDLTQKPGIELLVAVDAANELMGAVVYFDDMQHYGSGGSATREVNAAGFRLLGVKPEVRGGGVGKQLTLACIERAQQQGRGQVIIHTTKAMLTAWRMYEAIGFRRSPDLDFMQGDLEVVGFRLKLGE